jgi:hypothetical protein
MRTLLLGDNLLGSRIALERSRSLAELHSMWASPPGSPTALSCSPPLAAGLRGLAGEHMPVLTQIRRLDLSRTCLSGLPAGVELLRHLEELLLTGIVGYPGQDRRCCPGASLRLPAFLLANGDMIWGRFQFTAIVTVVFISQT